MRIEAEASCDVLVVGGGIAGTQAAVAAAREGARVTLACAGPTFSGSSFAGSTWGVGLVGPDGADDVDDLARAIRELGQGMADPVLARALAAGIPDAVERLESQGVALRRPADAGEREYVPCFDSHRRLWRGLERAPYREAVGRELARLGVGLLPHCELVELVEEGQRRVDLDAMAPEATDTTPGAGAGIAGVLLFDTRDGRAFCVHAPSVVLATGGCAGLFAGSLAGAGTDGVGHALALRHGATLTNLEFLQVMPTIVSPVRDVVFNEKSFRWARVDELERRRPDDWKRLLELRAGHGPTSARVGDHDVDLALASPQGAGLRYEGLPDPLPEFVESFFSWLEGRGVARGDELRVGLAAQASNGGILIGTDAGVVGVPGLFACGECAGGMHGADRIGGLASASCLVFGQAAGAGAARRALGSERVAAAGAGEALELRSSSSPLAPKAARELRQVMAEGCLFPRDAHGLGHVLHALGGLRGELAVTSTASVDARRMAQTAQVRAELLCAEAMARMMLERAESRGSHFRADFPEERDELGSPLRARLGQGRLELKLAGGSS